jgi:CRISPR-associated protein Cas1
MPVQATWQADGLPYHDLEEAWLRVQENHGCCGSDGVTVEHFAERAEAHLNELRARVDSGGYRPLPLLKIVVQKKPNSPKMRTLLVPAVGDRVLQTAVARRLSRSFEDEFLDASFGYRHGRSVDQAIARIRKYRELGFEFVLDCDILGYFDHIDHALLLAKLPAEALEEPTGTMIRAWIHAEVWTGHDIVRLRRGVPQGSPLSPLLANYFLGDLDRALEKCESRLIRYADDFVVLAKSRAAADAAFATVKVTLAALKLQLQMEKTRITTFEDSFQFLGAVFWREGILIPWKEDRRKPHVLFMAHPMPTRMIHMYQTTGPPRTGMEEAFRKANIGKVETAAKPAADTREVYVSFLYLTEQGAVLRKAGDRILVEKEDRVLIDLPYHKLENVIIFGNVQVTTQAMGELLEKGVRLSLFSYNARFRGSLIPPRGSNVLGRSAQFEAARALETSLPLAKAVVQAKIANGLGVLRRYRERNDARPGFDAHIATMEQALGGAGGAASIAGLDGMEGTAAREYFGCLMGFNKSNFEWPGRLKHPATDPLNALLSLAYTLLMHELMGLLESSGLDPYFGFLHQLDAGRPSLALDLVEPFRHPAADRMILGMVNRGMFAPGDFHAVPDGGLHLSEEGLKRYLTEYERFMRAIPKKADGTQQPTFRDRLRLEVVKLNRALTAGKAFEPFLFDNEEDAACDSSSVTI